MNFCYKFPAVRGMLGKKEYYIGMMPMRLLSKIFSANDNESVQPEFRSQRRINESRIPEIKKYILENDGSYVFSALCASIDGNFEFVSSEIDQNVGQLEIDMDAVLLINDGQHRKAAIEAAIRENSKIGNDSISIVFFKDTGLKRSQQMFADLNKHAVKTSNSLATLYDNRDELAVCTTKLIGSNSFFEKYADMERDILGKNSSKLFTLNNIYKANLRIVKKKSCSKEDEKFINNFWNEITNSIVEWNELLKKEITKKDLRENYIITLGILINALGRLGAYFNENREIEMHYYLKKLEKIDWHRSNKKDWLNRAIRSDGKVMNNEDAITLTCNRIKFLLEIPLTNDEQNKEKKLMEK
ncbi:MAG: DNA sulfur modification protein DndB [Bacilli bacterium]